MTTAAGYPSVPSPGAPAARHAATGRRFRPRLRRFLPPQHGAWAMLLLPYLAAVLVVGLRWPHLPLLGAWLAGYLFSYYALQAVKTRRPGRVRQQLIGYAAAATTLGVIVVAASPRVLALAPAYGLLLAVNARYAWRRQERAVLNDVASVLQGCLMVFVVAAAAGTPLVEVTGVFLAVLGYFVGTVLYVKTMIRQRHNVAFRRWSIGYHALALVASVWLGPLVAIVFAVLLVRASVLPGRQLSPKRVGVMEILNSVLLLVAIVITWR